MTPSLRLPRHAARRTPLRGALLGLSLCMLALAARADRGTDTGNGTLSATARLDFTIRIEKFVFLQVGNEGVGNVNTASFTLTPATPASPVTGNGSATNWSGAAPGFNVSASGNALPVAVRSNTGNVTLRVTSSAALSSGANTLPLSGLAVSSSDPGLPAPPLDGSASVNVSPTSTLVTERGGTWTFSYTPAAAALAPAGSYQGWLIFTASSL